MLPIQWKSHLEELQRKKGNIFPTYIPTVLVLLDYSVATVTHEWYDWESTKLVGPYEQLRDQLGMERLPYLELEMGVYNSWFLRAYAEQAIDLPKGWRVNTMRRTEVAAPGSITHGEIFDKDMYALYTSDEPVLNYDNPASIVPLPGLVALAPHEIDPCVDDEGRTKPCLPGGVGYWKIFFWRSNHDDEYKEGWIKLLAESGYSYVFNEKKDKLYFSNTAGSKYGLPPSPRHLGIYASIKPIHDGNCFGFPFRGAAQDYGCETKPLGGRVEPELLRAQGGHRN